MISREFVAASHCSHGAYAPRVDGCPKLPLAVHTNNGENTALSSTGADASPRVSAPRSKKGLSGVGGNSGVADAASSFRLAKTADRCHGRVFGRLCEQRPLARLHLARDRAAMRVQPACERSL